MKTLTLLAALILSLAGFSCQKSKQKAGLGNQDYWATCTNCQNIQQGQPLLESVQAQTVDQSTLFSLQVYGNPGPGCMQPMNKLIICAQGNATIGGIMRVQNGNMFCGIPNGDYQVQPVQTSQITQGVIFGGQYQAVGPGGHRIVLQLQSAILTNPNGLDLLSRHNRIGLNASVTRSDGAFCGWISTH